MNKKAEIPVLFYKKEECCGCSACYAICPQRAIDMVADTEEFLYPEIQIDLCIGCKKCIGVCPMKSKE